MCFQQAWAEEEAKVQRSLVSYALERSRKSEGTRLDNTTLTSKQALVLLAGRGFRTWRCSRNSFGACGLRSDLRGTGVDVVLEPLFPM